MLAHFRKKYLRLHLSVLGELEHLLPELHLLLDGQDVGGESGQPEPQVRSHLEGFRKVHRHGLEVLAESEVGGHGEAAVTGHRANGASVVGKDALKQS